VRSGVEIASGVKVLEGIQTAPRIAILNAHWPVHSSIGYIADHLAMEGYAVDVFLYRSDEKLSGDLLKASSLVKVHRFGDQTNPGTKASSSSEVSLFPTPAREVKSLKARLFQLAKQLLPSNLRTRMRRLQRSIIFRINPERRFIPICAVNSIVKMSEQNPYVALIGVEKGGLAWAGMVAKKTKAPLVYYSLELYTSDHPWIVASDRMKKLKALEENYHCQCDLTIIQDEHRGRVLLSDNRVQSPMSMAYLPVSISGSTIIERSNWLHNELGLSTDKVVILSYGMMTKQRRCVDLARVAQSFPENWCLVFHGYGAPELREEIQRVDTKNRVCFSLNLVPSEQRQEVVSSAKIGLAIYDSNPINDRLTGLSSEKIAMYFQCGLPLIAFRHPSYEHIEADQSGVLVDRLEDIPAAIEHILIDYDSYVERAFTSYKKHYCFEENIKPLVESLHYLHADSGVGHYIKSK
jgi:glycosyltransferase involved in cell wall biosynthesis